MLVGQDEKQLGALIVPNNDQIYLWLKEQGLSIPENFENSLENLPLRGAIKREMNRILSLRKNSRPEERIIGVAMVNSFSIENGLLTQTLKQKREQIALRDSEAIASIYGREFF